MLTDDTLRCIYAHAASTYPEECCGFVFSDGSVHQGVNIQNELNELSPGVYRRSATNGYTFSVADTVLLNGSFRGKNPVVIIYHSHPDVGAYFSKEDQDKALFMGEPVFPVTYLVVDVRAGEARGAKLFQWEQGCFNCCQEFPYSPSIIGNRGES
ncbi:Mov34/MPN/PAD-1 family protein [Thauera sp. ZXT1-4]|uniref:Mov34/MPN/PAD-1 family protein n=1 Tax=Thauera sp. ZXT1-4 TaxID=3460294 RepID=UPI004040B217